MARRKPVTEDDETEPITQEDIDFFDFTEEIGPQISSIDIFKINKDGSRPQCERVTVDVLKADPYEYLRATWGAGKYWLQFKGADRRVKSSKTIDVAARVDAPQNGHGQPNGPDKSADMLREHLQFMQQQNAKQETMLMGLITALAGRPQPTAPDPSAMLTAVVTSFATLKNAAAPPDPLAQIKPVIELVKELQPEASGGDSWAGVARDVGKGLLEVFAKPSGQPVVIQPAMPMATMQPIPARIVPAEVATSPGARENPPVSTDPNASRQHWLRVGIDYLKQKSALAKDPENYVDWALDNLEEPPCGAIHATIREGATIEHLLAFDPEIAQNPAHVQWFTAFLAKYHEALADMDAPLVDAGAGRDVGNAPGHADVSIEGASGRS